MQILPTCGRRMARSTQRVIGLGWRDAEPTVVQLLAHSFVIGIGALCLAAMLLVVWFLLHLGDLLFGTMELYVKGGIVVGELLFSIYIVRFTHHKSRHLK
jgi:hypothetical protein